MTSIRLLALTTLVTAAPILPVSAYADSGTVETLLSGIRSFTTMDVGGTQVTAGSAQGTVTWLRSSDPPFTQGDSGSAQCVVWSKKTAGSFDLEAHCAVQMDEQDRLYFEFKRKTGDIIGGTSGEGVQRITGGTGRFAGITGQCSYTVKNLANDRNVTLSKCAWRR